METDLRCPRSYVEQIADLRVGVPFDDFEEEHIAQVRRQAAKRVIDFCACVDPGCNGTVGDVRQERDFVSPSQPPSSGQGRPDRHAAKPSCEGAVFTIAPQRERQSNEDVLHDVVCFSARLHQPSRNAKECGGMPLEYHRQCLAISALHTYNEARIGIVYGHQQRDDGYFEGTDRGHKA